MPKSIYIILFMWHFAAAQQYNYYFGNLHAHTAFSDGNKDSVTSLIKTPAESYNYAALSNNFDFLGISEHNHYSSNRNPGLKLPRYQQGLNMADSMNADNTFLSLYGMEYGVSSNNNGHVIIYGFNQLIGWESNVGGGTGPNYNIYNPRSDYEALFRKVKNNPGAFCYLAHPFWTDFCTDGTDSSAIAFAKYNAMFDSAIVGLPLRSGNAFSAFDNYSDYVTTDYFAYYKKMLHNGYHLGIGYDHDNHFSNFGRSNGGRLAVLMPSLSRANLYLAMQQMHFYGTDDSNAKLHFELNGAIMGSQLTSDQYPSMQIFHDDPDGELADTIRIWKGWKTSSAWAFTVQTVTGTNSLNYYDTQIQKGIEYYYFVELRQKDGQWMVSSPIWYTAGNALGIFEGPDEEQIIVSPQPANERLSLAFRHSDHYVATLFDLQGTALKQGNTETAAIDFLVSDLAAGCYLLKINSNIGTVYKKVFIN